VIAWKEEIGSEDAPMEVSEDYIRKLSAEGFLKLTLFELDNETNEESEVDSLAVDISCLIFPKAGKPFEWTFD
jgi:hypothetical protein